MKTARAALASALAALALAAAPALLLQRPEPRIHDEFSHLLAADTFAHGRLANAPPPLARRLQAPHELLAPAYASKYPPAQGLFLALGQRLGDPLLGVWISFAAMAAAFAWMLSAFAPPRWALLGALLGTLALATARDSLSLAGFGYWAQSFWGGAAAALGGALALGAAARIVRALARTAGHARGRDAFLLGAGVALLAASRPYEGLFVAVPCLLAAALAVRRAGRPSLALPFAAAILPGAAFLLLLNLRVTGDPLLLPYQLHARTYEVVPTFLWRPLRAEPVYTDDTMRRFHSVELVEISRPQRRDWTEGRLRWRRLGDALVYFPGPALLAACVALPAIVRRRRARLPLLVAAGGLLGLLVTTWYQRHYAAPYAGALLALAVLSLRRVALAGPWRLRSAVVAAVVLAAVALGGWSVRGAVRNRLGSYAEDRARMAATLQRLGGKHLVLVRTSPSHPLDDEWAFNAADVAAAPVVWARSNGGVEDAELLDGFPDRAAWSVDADAPGRRLAPLPRRRVPAPR